MTNHNEQHEGLLLDLFAGDRSEQDQEIKRLLGGCAECAEKFASLRFLTARLDGVAAQQREDLAPEAGAFVGEPSTLSVQATLERLSVGSGPQETAVGGQPWLRWSSLAAASVGVFFLVRAMVSGAAPLENPRGNAYEGLTLGADIESQKQDLSIWKEAGELHVKWSVSRVAGGSFLLWVYGTGDFADQDPYASGSLSEAEFIVPQEELAKWKGQVEVVVQELDASGNDFGHSLSRYYSLP